MTRTLLASAALAAVSALAEVKHPRQYIYPPEFAPGRPYSPGVLANDTLYIAGQIDKDPKTGAQPSGIAAQTRQAMTNMGHVLRAAKMDFGNVVTCHVQLKDMANYKDMNEAYGAFFTPGEYPARTTLEFPGLPGGANIEVTCIAYRDKSKIKAVVPADGTFPKPGGPYRAGVWAGDTLYVSGTGGRDPKGGTLDPTIEGQTRQSLANVNAVITAAGLEMKDSVFSNVYFLDPNGYQGNTYGKLNSVYKDAFKLGLAPSRASFCLSKLPGTISVELTFIATRDRAKGRVVPDSAGPSPTSSNGGVIASDTLYTSGKSGNGNTFQEQMHDSIRSIENILKLAGMDLRNVVDAHVYLKDTAQMSAMDGIFREYFPKNPPARTTLQVIQQQQVQVQVVAVR